MTKCILAIDGGGIKGVFPASFLATIEDSVGGRIVDYFDLIVGTSTGGIIALGLGLGLSAEEILRFYEDSGSKVFGGNHVLRNLKRLGIAKYDNRNLRSALQGTFGDQRLGESKTRVVIPSMNLETGQVYIYKTAHHPKLERDYGEGAVEVALATASAPTFFPTHRSSAGIPLIDGGVWANNPVGLAVVEAVGVLEWPRDALRVLSVGCTSELLDIGKGRSWSLGLGYWGTKIIDLFMTAQSSASLGTAQVLAGHENVVRICPYVPKGRFSLDAHKEMDSLKGLGASEARYALPRIRPMFFSEPAEDFVPYKQVGD